MRVCVCVCVGGGGGREKVVMNEEDRIFFQSHKRFQNVI